MNVEAESFFGEDLLSVMKMKIVFRGGNLNCYYDVAKLKYRFKILRG